MSWSWLYGSWIYNYPCNQCLSPLRLWVVHVEVNSIHQGIKFVSDLWQVCGFLQILLFPPPVKLTPWVFLSTASYQLLFTKQYHITGNFCSVKFLQFWLKRRHFCRLIILAPKKIVCFTGSNNWSDEGQFHNVTINNCCTVLSSKNIFSSLESFQRLQLLNKHLVASNFSKKLFFPPLFSRSILLIWLIDFWCFNATFSNISAISWRPVLVVEEAGVSEENHRPWASNW